MDPSAAQQYPPVMEGAWLINDVEKLGPFRGLAPDSQTRAFGPF